MWIGEGYFTCRDTFDGHVCLCSKQPDGAGRAVLLMCTAPSYSRRHRSLEHLFPNCPRLLPFPSFIVSPAVIGGAQQLAGDGSPSLAAFSVTLSISWLLSTQESSSVDIVSTLEGAITFGSLLTKLSLTVHPTCPAVPVGWDFNKFGEPFYRWSLGSFLGGQR